MGVDVVGPVVQDAEAERLLREADAALARGEREAAEVLFREMVAQYAAVGALEQGLEALEQRGRRRFAAELAEQEEHWVTAAALWQRQGSLDRAARALEAADEVRAAAELFEQAGELRRAAALYEARGALLIAAELLERDAQPRAAADLLVRVSSIDPRLRPYASALSRRAGALYLKAQDVDQAVRVFQGGSHDALAAASLRQVGRSDEAARLYAGHTITPPTQAQLEARAREAEQAGQAEAAATAWEKAGRLARAGRSWEAAGDPRRAATLYEAAGEAELAMELYQSCGALEDAIRCAQAEGELERSLRWGQQLQLGEDALVRVAGEDGPLAAGQLALLLARRGQDVLYPCALQHLERAAEQPQGRILARVLTAEIQAELGNQAAAQAQLERLFQEQPPGPALAPARYRYARLAEAQGDAQTALSGYAAVLRHDRDHRDARRRWARLARATRAPHRNASTSSLLDRELAMLQSGEVSIPPGVLRAHGGAAAPMWSVDIPGATPGWFGPQSSPSFVPLAPSQPPPSVEPAQVSRSSEPSGSSVPSSRPESSALPEAAGHPEQLLGQTLRDGRFRIERMVGKGSQAVVYLARDTVLDREVAIKVLRERAAASQDASERFLREARLAARVHHASCLSVFDFGEAAPRTFMAMEYFGGRTLRQLIQRGALPLAFSLKVLEAVAGGLGAIHQAGIVHRDIKPSNVLVNRRGQVRIADFGVACLMADVKASGVMVGTMKYIAPEQAQGLAVDRRADIFSYGALAFELLSGEPAFGGDLEALIARASKPPPLLPESLDLPVALRRLVQRCMAKRPRHRFTTVEPIVEQLRVIRRQLEAREEADIELSEADVLD